VDHGNVPSDSVLWGIVAEEKPSKLTSQVLEDCVQILNNEIGHIAFEPKVESLWARYKEKPAQPGMQKEAMEAIMEGVQEKWMQDSGIIQQGRIRVARHKGELCGNMDNHGANKYVVRRTVLPSRVQIAARRVRPLASLLEMMLVSPPVVLYQPPTDPLSGNPPYSS